MGMTDAERLMRALGQEIQSWRRLRKLSREELAKAVEISETTMGRIERDGPVDVGVTWRIANVLGVNFADLVRRAEEMAAHPQAGVLMSSTSTLEVGKPSPIGKAAVYGGGPISQPDIKLSDGSILEVKSEPMTLAGTVIEDPTDAGRGFIVSADELQEIRQAAAKVTDRREVAEFAKSVREALERALITPGRDTRADVFYRVVVYPSASPAVDWEKVLGTSWSPALATQEAAQIAARRGRNVGKAKRDQLDAIGEESQDSGSFE